MAKTMLGAFEHVEDADLALTELESLGYRPSQISVISSKKEFTHGQSAIDHEADMGTHVKEGAVTGGVVGGIAGLLAGVGVVPALAGLFLAGPIVAALGIAGVAGAMVAGAATGAVAGGLIGALVKAGVPKETAEYYDQVVTEGGVLLGVSADTIDTDVQMVFEKHNARSIQTMDIAEFDSHEAAATSTDHERIHEPLRRAEPAFGERLDDDI